MSKVIRFSRTFLKGHPRQGQPTHFVEKIWAGFMTSCIEINYRRDFESEIYDFNKDKFLIVSDFKRTISHKKFTPKFHTIRAGNRFKVGDMFTPKCWSGFPYKSKQIVLMPDIEVKKVWNIEIKRNDDIDISAVFCINGKELTHDEIRILATNDGLYFLEFIYWFVNKLKNGETFCGQIICWNENINY